MEGPSKLQEIYSPPDPIKGVITYRGKVLVFTANTLYAVIQPTWFERVKGWLKTRFAW